ncbi:MAG TPA: hypothetical protein VFX03_16570, partial [Thermomicrobiales bacterium]|nr:hypothetical protein [Thermomicrobiales bacterium]
ETREPEQMASFDRSDFVRDMLQGDLYERKLFDRLIEIATEGRGAVINAWEPAPVTTPAHAAEEGATPAEPEAAAAEASAAPADATAAAEAPTAEATATPEAAAEPTASGPAADEAETTQAS